MTENGEKEQVLDGLNLIDTLFSNLEDLIFDVYDKVKNNDDVGKTQEIVDAVNRSISTIRVTIEYINDNIQSGKVKDGLEFYNTWITYLNRTLNLSIDDDRLLNTIFAIITDVIIDVYRSFRDFKKQIEESINGNKPITTGEV
ncbi:hypothetical protein [Acidianus bottle-shaped virus 2 strain ABV2]|uniref:Uncharacterized protein n=1 Tax=Acidianus bottle-shaped virus 2 strain ABV2 TaxID=1732173 RepID=A0A0N7FYX0_9VIRU|nr:hypothetical protein AVU01_gp48 [Acidianus bottle-shaped virus 2 strain ABV2]ALG96796.1 hypothetical protein [Acidianus bottle-shaped virus 2 strain ABV2]